MTKPLGVTNHCIVRFLERVDGYDFSSLKLEYMLENSIPSIRYINDKEFVKWIDLRLDVQPFRDKILAFVKPFITEGNQINIDRSPRQDVHVFTDNHVFVIKNRNILTVRKRLKCSTEY